MGAFQNCLPLGLCFIFVVVSICVRHILQYFSPYILSTDTAIPYRYGILLKPLSQPPHKLIRSMEKSLNKKKVLLLLLFLLVANDCQRFFVLKKIV